MKRLALYILHDQVDIAWTVYCLKESHYVRVLETGQYSDLSLSLLFSLGINKFSSVILLDCYTLARRLVSAFFYDGVGTLTYLTAEVVRVYV